MPMSIVALATGYWDLQQDIGISNSAKAMAGNCNRPHKSTSVSEKIKFIPERVTYGHVTR